MALLAHPDSTVGLHPVVGPALRSLVGGAHGGREDHDVVEIPDPCDGDAVPLVGGHEQTVGHEEQAQDGQHHEHDHGPRRAPVELGFVELSALWGHVEGAVTRGDHRHGGDHCGVPGDGGLEDLRPEAVAGVAVAGCGHRRGQEQVRDRHHEDVADGALQGVEVEDQVERRRQQVDDAWDAEEEVAGGDGVVDALGEPEPTLEQREVEAQDLRHATRPANALTHVEGEALGGETRRLREVEVDALPAAGVHLQRGVGVFGDGLLGDATHFFEGLAAKDRTRTTEEGRVPEVVALLDEVVEERLFRRDLVLEVEVSLEGIGVVEVVRGLDQGRVLVVEEEAHGGLQEAAHGHVIGVEDGDELAVTDHHGVVDIAGLGALVVGSGDVAAAQLLAELLHLGATAIVEDVDLFERELLGGAVLEGAHPDARVVDAEGTDDRATYDVGVFVVGGDEDVHRWQLVLGHIERNGGPLLHHRRLEVAAHHDGEAVELGAQQGDGQRRVRQRVQVQRLGRSPPQVPTGRGQGDEGCRQSPLGSQHQDQHPRTHHGQGQRQLGHQAQR